MKFENIPLRVPNVEKIKKQFNLFKEEFLNANNADEALKVIKKVFKYQDNLVTDMTVISVRFSINTLDKKVAAANEKVDEVSPLISDITNDFNDLILTSKFRKELEEKLGSYYFQLLENDKKIFSKEIIPDLVEESKLVNKYDALLASAQIEFDGETRNLSQLGKYMSSPNREIRINAAKLYYGFLKEHDGEIGEIYDKLVHLRTNMAHKLGYKSYTELGYLKLRRLDYNTEMVSNYRKKIY